MFDTPPLELEEIIDQSRASKMQIIDMALNGSGVRNTARTLKIGINTVIRATKR